MSQDRIPSSEEAPAFRRLSYDPEADVLYVSLGDPVPATDSELTEDDVIVRYHGNRVIGYTILHASRRARLHRRPDRM